MTGTGRRAYRRKTGATAPDTRTSARTAKPHTCNAASDAASPTGPGTCQRGQGARTPGKRQRAGSPCSGLSPTLQARDRERHVIAPAVRERADDARAPGVLRVRQRTLGQRPHAPDRQTPGPASVAHQLADRHAERAVTVPVGIDNFEHPIGATIPDGQRPRPRAHRAPPASLVAASVTYLGKYE